MLSEFKAIVNILNVFRKACGDIQVGALFSLKLVGKRKQKGAGSFGTIGASFSLSLRTVFRLMALLLSMDGFVGVANCWI